MTGQINVNKIAARTGNAITIASGDVLQAPGHVLQVVQQVFSTSTNITSTSYTATGLTKAITPTSASSKILVLVNLSAEVYQLGTSGTEAFLQITKGGSEIASKRVNSYMGAASNGYYAFPIDGNMMFLDSPNTTSATTYAVNGKLSTTSNQFTMRVSLGSSDSTLTLMEIAG